jgi:N-acetylglucosamine-6-sulfatase
MTRMVGTRVGAALAALAVPLALLNQAPSEARFPRPVASGPNVLLIVLDDATWNDISAMDNVKALARRGTVFSRTYSPDPFCCPARATILTGRYPHNHRVLDNVAPLGGFTAFNDSSTLATWLDRDYRTGLFGKYMNDNSSQRSYVPPGWDTFAMPTRRATYRYVGPRMYVNGRLRNFAGQEATHVYSRQAAVFMRNSIRAGKPFFAYLAVVTPHIGPPHDDYPDDPVATPWVPERFRYTETRDLPNDPSVNEADVSDKPAYIQGKPELTQADLDAIAERRAQKRESLKAVDEEIGTIVNQLSALGALDETYIMLVSDNGYMDGQHRVARGKSLPYEPASRVPLIIRGPGFPRRAVYDRVTGLQDLAPTILSVTHESASTPVDGVNLRRLANGTGTTNRPLLIEIPVTAKLSDNEVQRGAHPSRAQARRLRTVDWFARGLAESSGWKYVEYPRSGEKELYNLNADPYELDNLAGDRRYAGRMAKMAKRLRTWSTCSGPACR